MDAKKTFEDVRTVLKIGGRGYQELARTYFMDAPWNYVATIITQCNPLSIDDDDDYQRTTLLTCGVGVLTYAISIKVNYGCGTYMYTMYCMYCTLVTTYTHLNNGTLQKTIFSHNTCRQFNWFHRSLLITKHNLNAHVLYSIRYRYIHSTRHTYCIEAALY